MNFVLNAYKKIKNKISDISTSVTHNAENNVRNCFMLFKCGWVIRLLYSYSGKIGKLITAHVPARVPWCYFIWFDLFKWMHYNSLCNMRGYELIISLTINVNFSLQYYDNFVFSSMHLLWNVSGSGSLIILVNRAWGISFEISCEHSIETLPHESFKNISYKLYVGYAVQTPGSPGTQYK